MSIRIQRRRAKGWRLPDGAICVDRSTAWGNPFVVGRDGTVAECVGLYAKLLAGYLCLTAKATLEEQFAARSHVMAHIGELHGHDLACWCREDALCHGDVLLRLAEATVKCPGESA